MGTSLIVSVEKIELDLVIIARSTENVLVKEGDVFYLIPLSDEDLQILHLSHNGTQGEDQYGNSTYEEPTSQISEISDFQLWSIIKKLDFPLHSTDWECENLQEWTISEITKLSNIVTQIRNQKNRLDYIGGDLFLDFKFEIYNGDFATLKITSPKSSLETELFYEDDKLFIDLHKKNEVRVLGFISMYAQNVFQNQNHNF